MIYYIYVLIDPRTCQVRYVGQTVNPIGRHKEHSCKQKGTNYREKWLNRLRYLNLSPIMILIEECINSNWAEREKYWIKWYREDGCDLVNATDGGEGTKGLIFTEEHKHKISESHKGENNPNFGKSPSEETRRKISEANIGENNPYYGKQHTKETRIRMSISAKQRKNQRRGYTLTEQQKQQISESLKGNRNAVGHTMSVTDEVKEYLSFLHTGKHKGELNQCAKLTEKDVIEIRERVGTNAGIAEEFNISASLVSMIKTGKRWGWLK